MNWQACNNAARPCLRPEVNRPDMTTQNHYIILGRQQPESEQYIPWEFYGEASASSPEEAVKEVGQDEYRIGDQLRVLPVMSDDEGGGHIEYREYDLDL